MGHRCGGQTRNAEKISPRMCNSRFFVCSADLCHGVSHPSDRSGAFVFLVVLSVRLPGLVFETVWEHACLTKSVSRIVVTDCFKVGVKTTARIEERVLASNECVSLQQCRQWPGLSSSAVARLVDDNRPLEREESRRSGQGFRQRELRLSGVWPGVIN